MPRNLYSFGGAGFSIDHEHLQVAVRSFWKKDIAADGEVLSHLGINQRHALDLRIGLVLRFRLSHRRAPQRALCDANRAANSGARSHAARRQSGQCARGGTYRALSRASDRAAFDRCFELVSAARLARRFDCWKRRDSLSVLIKGENLAGMDRSAFVRAVGYRHVNWNQVADRFLGPGYDRNLAIDGSRDDLGLGLQGRRSDGAGR